MAIQVNIRLDEADWERVVAALPGLSNAERLTQIVQHHLTTLDAQHDLARALTVIASVLEPARQALQQQRLQGQGSLIVEELSQCVVEMSALLLAHSEDLQRAPQKHLPALESKLVRRWSQATSLLLQTAMLDPSRVSSLQGVQPEVRKLLAQAALLSRTAADSPAGPASPTSQPA